MDERGHPHFLGTGEWVAPSNPWYRRVGGPIQSLGTGEWVAPSNPPRIDSREPDGPVPGATIPGVTKNWLKCETGKHTLAHGRFINDKTQRRESKRKCEWRKGFDHRRESVVQTGAASNLGRQPDPPAPGMALMCEAGGHSPRPNHVLTHVVTSHCRSRATDFPRLWRSSFFPSVPRVGTQDNAANLPAG